MGCYNPTEGTSEVYEYKSNDPGPKTILDLLKNFNKIKLKLKTKS